MQHLLPACLVELDQQVMLLDGEEVENEDGLDNNDDSVRREFLPVVDVIDAEAEAVVLGNLLAADADDVADNDDFDAPSTALLASSGTALGNTHA